MEATDTSSKPTLADRLRDVPAWATILSVALVLGGAGWLIYRQWFAMPSAGQEIDVGPVNTGRRFARTLPPPPREGVATLGAGLWRVKSGDFSMQLPIKSAEIHVYYDKADLVPPDQLVLLQARRNAVSSPTAAKRMNLSAEQIKQLQAIPLRQGEGLKLEPADRDRLKALWDAYNAAADEAKKAKEPDLLAALKQIGTDALAPTRQRYAQRAAEIKAVFTPEQLKGIK